MDDVRCVDQGSPKDALLAINQGTAKGNYCSLDTGWYGADVVLLKCVHIPMLMIEGNDLISLDVVRVVNGIHSATANIDYCSVMITDPVSHHNTTSTRLS